MGLFRHKHELETGRTSSVGMEVRNPCVCFCAFSNYCVMEQILGFSPSGAPILPNTSNSTDQDVIRREKLGWDEISVQAAKIVSFIGRLILN